MSVPGTPSGTAGIGSRVPRVEDARFLNGRGVYVADLRFPDMTEAAFVRSPVAHGMINDIIVAAADRAHVFIAADMGSVRPIALTADMAGFKQSAAPALATGKVRYAGEPVALCLGETRALAEDLAERIELRIDPLPPVMSMAAAAQNGNPRVHDAWGDNVAYRGRHGVNPFPDLSRSPVVIRRRVRLNRHAMVPMEGYGIVALKDPRSGQLHVHATSQNPHVLRTGLAYALGLEQRLIRVISPDVGGGFGYKLVVPAEAVAVCWAAWHTGRPVRWLEDRREHLCAGVQAREHEYDVTLYADAEGRILGLEADARSDSGAYSCFPTTQAGDISMASANLTGPYHIPVYQGRPAAYATNKPPLTPYRGVGRTGACFALETVIDILAREVGHEPHDIRLRNLVPAAQMPYQTATGKQFDSGDYPQCLRRLLAHVDVPAIRARQLRGEPDGRRIGLGMAMYTEQTAHGTQVFVSWGRTVVPGYEQAQARLSPDGALEIKVGLHNHGQGLETTLAQVAHEILGIPLSRISIIHGDTGTTPYSTGTYASRGMVMAGGAVAEAAKLLAKRIAAIGAHLMQVSPDQVVVRGDAVIGPATEVSIPTVADAWYLAPDRLPLNVDPGGLDVTAGHKPATDGGVYSYAAHAALVAVNPASGRVELLDYWVVEDCGTLVNPMIVDGQISGGVVQGIGTALFEELRFDADGVPETQNFFDYMVPGAGDVPFLRIDHMETPSPHTSFGIKGMGEGGAIPPPAAIANAVNDALAPLGAEILEVPLTPGRVLAAIQRAAQGQ